MVMALSLPATARLGEIPGGGRNAPDAVLVPGVRFDARDARSAPAPPIPSLATLQPTRTASWPALGSRL